MVGSGQPVERGRALRDRLGAGEGHVTLTDEAGRCLEAEVYAGRLTRRGAVRVHRVAWSVADLAGASEIATAHMAEAIQMRRGLPGQGG